jgi:hypothetical protein
VADLLKRRCTIGRLALGFAKAEAFPYVSQEAIAWAAAGDDTGGRPAQTQTFVISTDGCDLSIGEGDRLDKQLKVAMLPRKDASGSRAASPVQRTSSICEFSFFRACRTRPWLADRWEDRRQRLSKY